MHDTRVLGHSCRRQLQTEQILSYHVIDNNAMFSDLEPGQHRAAGQPICRPSSSLNSVALIPTIGFPSSPTTGFHSGSPEAQARLPNTLLQK